MQFVFKQFKGLHLLPSFMLLCAACGGRERAEMEQLPNMSPICCDVHSVSAHLPEKVDLALVTVEVRAAPPG